VPRVSILLPCRDAAAFLPDAIASLQAQTFRDWQVIAVDDGSADHTLSLLDRWRQRDRRVTVLAQPATGIIGALNAAAARADGVVLARMDADDVAHPRRLELQLRLLDDAPGIAACGTGVRYFPDAEVRDGARRYEAWLNGIRSPDDVEREAFVECPIAHPTLCMRRDAFEAVGGYQDHGWPEDYDLVLRLLARRHRIASVPRVLLRWRDRAGRASRTDPRYSPDAFRRCKVHYLGPLRLLGRDAVVWGSGPVGKAFARALIDAGHPVVAFVDLDPRKIGQVIHGAPVIAPGDVPRLRGACVLAAVGQPRARDEIRAALRAMDWAEVQEFCAVA
jgi:glycosyltransferase involved in cell wall biosynthesis